MKIVNNLMLLIEAIFILIAAYLITQSVVFIYWSYGILTLYPLEELTTITTPEWYEGLSTAWKVSQSITSKIMFVIVTYILIKLLIKNRLTKKQKTADALHFEYAYIEMRNLLAYTFNVIAGEINDGVTPLDAGGKEDEALKQRRELALNVVCKQTYNLNKSAHPITLEQHDALIEQFEHYLTLITCDDAPNEAFTDHHPTLNHLRYPDFEKEYELECELECEQFNRQSIDKNEEKQ